MRSAEVFQKSRSDQTLGRMSGVEKYSNGVAEGVGAVRIGRFAPITGGAAAMKVLVADHHRLMVEGIRRALEGADDIEIVGEANSGGDVLPLVGRLRPDVVLLDMRMPQMDGLTCLDELRKSYPEVKAIALSVFSDPVRIQAAFKHGASGYIVKSVDPRDLPSAIRQAVDGSVFHAIGLPEVDERTSGKAAGLTERELSILRAAAQGLSNAAIGKELWVTEQTVKFHLTNIYRKLDLANRTEAARYAYEHGLVESPLVEMV
jgi:DNA-binding NarL/FixJ family response regulator